MAGPNENPDAKKSSLCREHDIAGRVGLLDQRADFKGLPLHPECYCSAAGTDQQLKKCKVSRRLSCMALETNAHARVHDTFWLKSHPYPITLKSSACADCPWITFSKPKDLNENRSPRGSLAKKSPQPWMRWPATILLVLFKAKRKSSQFDRRVAKSRRGLGMVAPATTILHLN